MRRLLIVVLAVVGLAIAAPALGETHGVQVKDNVFAPKTAHAAPGDFIRFNWSSAENPHDVKFTKAPQGAKPAKCALKTSGKCKRKVEKAGVYKYVCTIHLASDNMRGKIVVE